MHVWCNLVRIFALAALIATATAAPSVASQPSPSPSATPPPWLDPFCSVSVAGIQWDVATGARATSGASNALVVELFSQLDQSASVDEHITVLTDTDAYDVQLKGVPFEARATARHFQALLVTLPKEMAVRYVYVDSYVANREVVSCPSEPSRVTPTSGRFITRIPKTAVAVATFRQTIPPLPCGQMYSEAKVLNAVSPIYPRSFSDHAWHRSVDVGIFVDSLGHAIKTWIYKSSGDSAFDASATLAAFRSTYQPPMLLCTPIVGEYLFKAVFDWQGP